MAEPSSEIPDDLRLRLLVMRCQVGDDQAFARLFEWFGPKTLRHLRGLIGDAADDVHQEVWLTVYRSISGIAAIFSAGADAPALRTKVSPSALTSDSVDAIAVS